MSPFSLLAGTARPPLGRNSVLRHSDRYRIGNVARRRRLLDGEVAPRSGRSARTSRLPLSAAIAVYDTAAEALQSPTRGS